MNKIFLLFISFFITVTAGAQAEEIVKSPFNSLILKEDSTEFFSFIVTGHLHGASSNVSGFPASSLLANLDEINDLEAKFLLSLGDIFLDVDDYFVNNYRKSLFDKLQIPLFNAVGNHDLSGNRYREYFGDTYFHFIHKNNFFIVLDTELHDGNIKGKQWEFFTNILGEIKNYKNIKNVFIASHRPVWVENNQKYSDFFKDNTRTKLGANNFNSEVYPLLKNELKDKNIYWFSGSMGAASVSFFYDKDENITFIQTAIRDLKRDAILKVNISQSSEVSFETVSLTGQELQKLEKYDVDFWKNAGKGEQEFNYRLLPYLTFQMLSHHYFWIGILSGFLLMLLSVFIFRRKFRS